ncbi:MAG: hypothetical protein AAF629_29210 [Chloroflexota bacterium]
MPDFSLDPSFATPQTTIKKFIRGNGLLECGDESLRFVNCPTTPEQYTNAQIDDYQGLPRRDFLWQPPLKLVVHARFSHENGHLKGTAGFGFWNDPFMMTGGRWPSLPKALWFFYTSPPSNMKLDGQTPGFGWKAATIDAWHWPFFALAPLAPIAVPLMNISPLYQLCWPLGQRAIRVSEKQISASMVTWQTYELIWQPDTVRFSINQQVILQCKTVPQGPLGLVVWFDNQYMVVTPWGKFGHGLIAESETQWMEIDQLTVTQG